MPTFSEKTLHQFFQDEIVAACRDLSQSPPPDTQMYLAHLLTRFGRANELFVQMEGRNELEPLPLMLKRALETDDETSRIRILKHLGDVALFTSGFHSERITSRGLDVRYYIDMGGMAYSNVSAMAARRPPTQSYRALYERLATHFQELVHLLWEIGERFQSNTTEGLLSLYKKWEQTRCASTARKLAQHGFILNPDPSANVC